ncbi:phage tail protein [Nitrospirillum amazonense]|uniref:Microcystin-dependent protein n=1 Tax=Nitrospirillum amazonense TaxID=28077 RepID=A0A560JR09_9PROT|nr:tail fiber protein [Nitrospirillum amazonense]MDG3442897.1 tail fiber protein [Nitrospirillum amazonense]TWB71964.1 microcystin-dependent protein [Nitrospirillum amazonense]
MEPFVGEIRIFTWNWAPKGWALCNGALLNLQQNIALYSLIGVYYGGNGTSNFNLPDLRGRTPRHLSQQMPQVGLSGGAETVTLTTASLPVHTHSVNVINGPATPPQTASLANHALASVTKVATNATIPVYTPPTVNSQPVATVTLPADTLATSGASAPVANMQPWVVANYCIALQGIFPPRN